jgi:type I site-specific restriction-modification system R (restriction) subunit
VPLLTEITKLADEQKVKQMAVDSFGDANLLLVDEGHRGMSGSDWKAKRDKLAAQGFYFRVFRHLQAGG